MTLCPDFSLYLQMYSSLAYASINCCLGDETTFKTFEKNYASKIQGYSIEKLNCSSKIQDWLSEILKCRLLEFQVVFCRQGRNFKLRKFMEDLFKFCVLRNFTVFCYFSSNFDGIRRNLLIIFAQYCMLLLANICIAYVLRPRIGFPFIKSHTYWDTWKINQISETCWWLGLLMKIKLSPSPGKICMKLSLSLGWKWAEEVADIWPQVWNLKSSLNLRTDKRLSF